jgi:hypothetical protein
MSDKKDTRQQKFNVMFYGGYVWELTREQYQEVLQTTLLDGEFPSSPNEGKVILRGYEHPDDFGESHIRRLLKDLKVQDQQASRGEEISDFITCGTIKKEEG